MTIVKYETVSLTDVDSHTFNALETLLLKIADNASDPTLKKETLNLLDSIKNYRKFETISEIARFEQKKLT